MTSAPPPPSERGVAPERSRQWARAAGWAGALLLLAALLLSLRPSRPERREVFDRYSKDYAALIAFCAFAGLWGLGGLVRRGSWWGRSAGAGFRVSAQVGGIVLITCAGAEIVSRTLERPLARFIGGPAMARAYSSLVRLNSHGIRDPERPFQKPRDTWRMVVLGDSFMFGQGVEDESTCVRFLERGLARPGGPRVEVINTARTGYNTVDERAVLDTLGLRYQPDLVLLGYVLNDPETRNLTFPELLPAPIAFRLQWSVFYHVLRAASYHLMVALGRRPEYDDWIHGLYDPGQSGWKTHVEALRGIVTDARAAGAPVVIAIWPLPDARTGFAPYRLAREQKIAVREARAAGAHVLDLLPTFVGDRYPDFALSGWDAHPNARSQRRAAGAILGLLEAQGLSPGGAPTQRRLAR